MIVYGLRVGVTVVGGHLRATETTDNILPVHAYPCTWEFMNMCIATCNTNLETEILSRCFIQ